MNFGKEILSEGAMSEAVEGGAALAWRLLATLEGGSLVLATSAILAYTARIRILKRNGTRHPVGSVLVTNTTSLLGRELKRQLKSRGCVVSSATDDATSGAGAEAGSTAVGKFDALVVIGAEPKTDGLEGMSSLVSEDVYYNLKLLESLSPLVRRGGRIAWACLGAEPGAASSAFSGASAAFDTVLQASLQHVAKVSHCVPVWVGRCDGTERTAERVVAALVPCDSAHIDSRLTMRNAAHKIGEYLDRWLKIIT